MQANSPSALFLSATLHGVIVALVLLFTYVWQEHVKEPPKVFELVAGEGDDYMATAAPALGVEGGIKVPLTEAPAARPAPPEPAPEQKAPERVVEAAPITPAPKAVTAPPPPEAIRDFSKDVKRIEKKRADRLVARDRAAREAAEKKAKLEEAKHPKTTKEEHDQKNKVVSATKSGSSMKIAHIDTDGIVKGVIGGSTANKTGGAGGKALTREEGDVIDGYTALLGRKIKEQLDERPGVGAGLIVEVEIRISIDGDISGFRILKSSGSSDFDDAVRDAFAHIRMPSRPKGLSELQQFPIRGID
jgi:colicin import membrane protein